MPTGTAGGGVGLNAELIAGAIASAWIRCPGDPTTRIIAYLACGLTLRAPLGDGVAVVTFFARLDLAITAGRGPRPYHAYEMDGEIGVRLIVNRKIGLPGETIGKRD